MSKHTAGPWRFWTQRRPGKEDTCTFQNLDGVEVLRAVTVTITEADARLIAAAPDLLAALEKIAAADTGEDGCFYTNRANIHIARSAISFMKAK